MFNFVCVCASVQVELDIDLIDPETFRQVESIAKEKQLVRRGSLLKAFCDDVIVYSSYSCCLETFRIQSPSLVPSLARSERQANKYKCYHLLTDGLGMRYDQCTMSLSLRMFGPCIRRLRCHGVHCCCTGTVPSFFFFIRIAKRIRYSE